jgi:hypothetical protein
LGRAPSLAIRSSAKLIKAKANTMEALNFTFLVFGVIIVIAVPICSGIDKLHNKLRSPSPQTRGHAALVVGGLLLASILIWSAWLALDSLPHHQTQANRDFGDVLMAGEAARAKLREQEAKASPIQSQFDRDGAEFTKILGMSYGMTIYYKFDNQPFGYVKDFNWSKVEIVSLNDGSATWYDRSFISANYVTKK